MAPGFAAADYTIGKIEESVAQYPEEKDLMITRPEIDGDFLM